MHLPDFRRRALSAAAALLAATQAHGRAGAAPRPAAGAPGTQEVVVHASADASAGGLKAPYAGGQVARGGRVGLLGNQDVMDTPFAITSYTAKLIQDQQSASLADVLQNDPAVRVTRGFGNFQQAYMVRGLVIYSDDISYNGLYGLLPRQYLAAELVERVEVLRGANAFLNGAAPGGSGLGGAVNVMPKRAADAPQAAVTAGAEGGQVSAALDVGRRFGDRKNLGLRANAVHRDGSPGVDGEKDKLDAVLLGADLHVGGMRVSADAGTQDSRIVAATPSIDVFDGVPAAPDAGRQLAQPWSYSHERDQFGTLRAEFDVRRGLTAWAAGGFREGREDNQLEGVTIDGATGTQTVSANANVRRDSIRTGEAGLRGTFATGRVRHTVVGSYGAYQSVSKNAYAFSDFAGVPGGTLGNTTFIAVPAETALVGGTLGHPLTTLRVVTSSQALADTLSFAGDRVLLTVGARRQQIESTTFDYDSGVQGTRASRGARVTPVAGIVLRLDKQVSLFGSYIEGLVAGDVAPDSYVDVDGHRQPVVNAKRAFKPYQTRQGEIGVKIDTGRYGGTVSVFESSKPNYGVDATTSAFGLTSTQRNRGAEISVYGEALPGVRVLGGASFLGARLQGRDVIGSPKSQFNLGIDVDVPGVEGLALDVRGVHTARQFADSANTEAVPAWTRLDLGGRYAFDVGAHEITLRAGIDNVANRRYWASAGGYPGQGYLTVGAPRRFVASATFAY